MVFELGAISSHRPHNVLVFLRLFFLIINIYNNVLLALLYIHFLLLRTIRIQTLLRETQNDWFIFFIDMTMSLKIVMWNLDLFFPLFLFFFCKVSRFRRFGMEFRLFWFEHEHIPYNFVPTNKMYHQIVHGFQKRILAYHVNFWISQNFLRPASFDTTRS